jgi:hypothetical protein
VEHVGRLVVATGEQPVGERTANSGTKNEPSR